MERSFFTTYSSELIMALIPFLFFNLVLIYLLIKSEFFNTKRIKTFLIVVDSIFAIVFIFAYFLLGPEAPRPRIAFTPVIINVADIDPDYAFALTDQLEENIRYVRQKQFYVHSQWWTFSTILESKQDSIKIYRDLSNNIKSQKIIQSELNKIGNQFELTFNMDNFNQSYTFSSLADFPILSEQIIDDLCLWLKIDNPAIYKNYFDMELIKTKKKFYNADYEELIEEFKNRSKDKTYTHPNTVFWIARSFTMQGAKLKEKVYQNNPLSIQYHIKDFNRAKFLLFKTFNSDKENFDIYLPLIELFIYEEDFVEAEDLIQTFLTDFGNSDDMRKTHPEILYYYSFLHPDRFRKDGYRYRADILRECLAINPFFERALIRLSNMIFYQIGSPIDKYHRIVKKLEFYSKINPYNKDIDILLGDYYISIRLVMHTVKLYKELLDKFKDDAIVHYNMGIAYYWASKEINMFPNRQYRDSLTTEKSIDLSEFHFKKALEIDSNETDSYLFLGKMYTQQKRIDEAIHAFRKRVRARKGPDDKGYEEAAKGLRNIFEDSVLLRQYMKKEGRI